MKLPDYLIRGEVARLIPVVADSRKEQRVVSALLAIFSAVPDFANAIISPLGQKITSRTTVNTFTEIGLKNEDAIGKDRPDGLINVQRGKYSWTMFVEAKIGGSTLEKEQLERYLRLARDNSIDALLTISNEFASRPHHHPVNVSQSLTKRVQLIHLSWTAILTEVILLHENASIEDPEQAFLIREFVRFLSHESVGVNGYTNMPVSWKNMVNTVQAGGHLNKKSRDLELVVMGWHQKVRDLSLQLSQYLGRRVDVRLSRSHGTKPDIRMQDDVEALSKTNTLNASFCIPDAASDLVIVADLRARAIRASMTVDAPRDKKRTVTRIKWLLRQLKDAEPTDVIIRIQWPSRAADSDIPLSTLRENPQAAEIVKSNALPRAFEVILNKASGRRFNGKRTFIEEIEDVCPKFYEEIGQHLKAWQPPPPKPKHPSEPKPDKETKPANRGNPSAGNEHINLLEIPKFLFRMTSGKTKVLSPIPNENTKKKYSHPSRFRAHLRS